MSTAHEDIQMWLKRRITILGECINFSETDEERIRHEAAKAECENVLEALSLRIDITSAFLEPMIKTLNDALDKAAREAMSSTIDTKSPYLSPMTKALNKAFDEAFEEAFNETFRQSHENKK